MAADATIKDSAHQHQGYRERFLYTPVTNLSRAQYDLDNRRSSEPFDAYWSDRNITMIPEAVFSQPLPITLEIGAGSGHFLVDLARLYPERYFVAIERDRGRGLNLIRKAERSGLGNIIGLRGNAVAAVAKQIPNESIGCLYFLYPCPWPKNSQRKHRWYTHPAMPHFFRILKPGGKIIWASDQSFYIDEARWTLEKVYGMRTLVHGEITPNEHNDLGRFDGGRTKFERSFLMNGLPCFELVAQKPGA